VVQVGRVMVNQQAHLQPREERDTNRSKVSRGELEKLQISGWLVRSESPTQRKARLI
jgi:hypothetical protein